MWEIFCPPLSLPLNARFVSHPPRYQVLVVWLLPGTRYLPCTKEGPVKYGFYLKTDLAKYLDYRTFL